MTRLSKGIKRKRKRTRNHRPTRKRKTRCYGHKDNKKYAKHVKNNACKRISIDPPGVEKLSQELSQLIHQVSRSCRDCDKKKLKNLNRQQNVEEVSRRCRASFSKQFFKKWKTQTSMQSNMQLNQWSNQHNNLSKSSLKKKLKHMDLKNTHIH